MTIVTAQGLNLGYRGTPLLHDLCFELRAGEILAVVGHNGCGKSTLVKTLLGVLPPVSGELRWPETRPDPIAYLGQITEFDRKFPLRVRDVAAMGAWGGLGFLGGLDAEDRRRIDRALEKAGISDIADMALHELSSGQLQRALFARTIVQDARLILLDEPFTAVDQTTESQLLQLIDDWAAEGRAVILVLHDLTAVLRHASLALLLGKGRGRFGAPSDVLTPAHLVDQNYMSEAQADWMAQMYGGTDV